jgi:hypothetical protein
VRRIIYTTNAIEPLNAKLRRAVRGRGHFPTDESALKLLFLVLNLAQKEWKMPPREWAMAKAQFAEGRFKLAQRNRPLHGNPDSLADGAEPDRVHRCGGDHGFGKDLHQPQRLDKLAFAAIDCPSALQGAAGDAGAAPAMPSSAREPLDRARRAFARGAPDSASGRRRSGHDHRRADAGRSRSPRR